MFIDARTLSADATIETDVCIIGSGPAGLTIARELMGQNFRVCLLESGDIEFNEQSQTLAKGTTVSPHAYPEGELTRGRCRQVGGSANYWNIQVRLGDTTNYHVRHVPLDPLDFEPRDWLPYSGWPFDYNHLEPFYHRAQHICQVGPFAYDADFWEDETNRRLPLGDRVVTNLFQFGPSAAFISDHRDAVGQASNITGYYNAHVLEIEANESGTQISRIHGASKPGQEFRVSARIVILATGGFENARLLLLSNKQQPNGLGNQHDLVGRFFMDHPGFRLGVVIPFDRKIFDSTALYDLRRVNGTPILARLNLAESVLRQEKLLNVCTMLVPKPAGYGLAVKPLMQLVRSLRRGKLPKDSLKAMGKVLANLGDTAVFAYRRKFGGSPSRYSTSRGGWSYLDKKPQRFSFFEAIAQIEQAPNPDNRVTLGSERDEFGRPKIKFHWTWSDIDLRSVRRTIEILQEEFIRSGIGQLYSLYDLNGATIEVDGQELPKFNSTHHHMGTTRMDNDPTQGVVDANCQVHGISNLYVAGSSVFPTVGYSNPTLTIVALAVRLADHIKQVMDTNAAITTPASPVEAVAESVASADV